MNEKPEALRVADECDWSAKFKAAKELRRLHAENERLREALDNLISACELPGDHCEIEQALPFAKAALRREETT